MKRYRDFKLFYVRVERRYYRTCGLFIGTNFVTHHGDPLEFMVRALPPKERS